MSEHNECASCLAWAEENDRLEARERALEEGLEEMLAMFIDPSKVNDLPHYTAFPPTFSGPTLAHLRKWHTLLPARREGTS